MKIFCLYFSIPFIFVILLFFGCEKVVDIQNNNESDKYIGNWVYELQNKYSIYISPNEISQVGFPLVNGCDIKYRKVNNTLYCNYRRLDSEKTIDSFRLEVLYVTDKRLELFKNTEAWSERIYFIR